MEFDGVDGRLWEKGICDEVVLCRVSWHTWNCKND